MANWFDVVLGLVIAVLVWEGLHWLLAQSDEACGPERQAAPAAKGRTPARDLGR